MTIPPAFRRAIPLLLWTLCLLPALSRSWALTPLHYFQGLVAGGDEPGFRDGSFTEARFNGPLGLAFDDTGLELYVADSANHRIRRVDLDRDDQVTTVAGSGSSVVSDGPLARAGFNSPTRLAFLPGNRLVVYDDGGRSLRLVDLSAQRVSTLVKDIHVLDMAYLPKDGGLYFSGEGNKIVRLDPGTGKCSDALLNDARLPSPGALCLYHGNLCVADGNSGLIYEVQAWAAAQSATAAAQPVTSASLNLVGTAKDVLALCASGDRLYALQKGGVLARVGTSGPTPVLMPTGGGFLMRNDAHKRQAPLLDTRDDLPAGFTVSPLEERRFFVSTQHAVMSVKDYGYERLLNPFNYNDDGLCDFDYPLKKPPHTFRVLLTGGSRNSTADIIPSDPDAEIDEFAASSRLNTFTKQLELLLNSEAVLRGSKVHFELLNMTQRGEAISAHAYYDYPAVVKKYEIDLVLSLGDWPGYQGFFTRPMTPEGIPSNEGGGAEFSSKPLSQRASSDVAKDALERCRALKIPFSEKQDYPGDDRLLDLFASGDPQLQDDMVEMTARPLRLFQEKLKTLRTSGGALPRFVVYYVPYPVFRDDVSEVFWTRVCARDGIPFIDLCGPFDALKGAFNPTARVHMTVYGNQLVAFLLEHYLIDEKLVPF